MMNRVDKWIWTAQWKAKNLVKDFFYNRQHGSSDWNSSSSCSDL